MEEQEEVVVKKLDKPWQSLYNILDLGLGKQQSSAVVYYCRELLICAEKVTRLQSWVRWLLGSSSVNVGIWVKGTAM